MFMRIVNLKVKEGRMPDFARFYENRVIPAFQESGGCLYASLLRPSDDDQECVSMTWWRDKEAADAYETSGRYDQLLDDSDDLLAEVSEGRVQSSAKSRRKSRCGGCEKGGRSSTSVNSEIARLSGGAPDTPYRKAGGQTRLLFAAVQRHLPGKTTPRTTRRCPRK